MGARPGTGPSTDINGMNRFMFFKNHIKAIAVIILATTILAIFYELFGYGYLTIDNATTPYGVFVDGSFNSSNTKKIKIRPGNHTVEISSLENDTTKKVNIPLFLSSSINAKETKRDFTKTLATLISADKEDAELVGGKLFKNDLYACILFLPDSTNFIVLSFDAGSWNLFYKGDGINGIYFTEVPQEIQDYFKDLSEKTFND
jgi:hypothetical protein